MYSEIEKRKNNKKSFDNVDGNIEAYLKNIRNYVKNDAVVNRVRQTMEL